MHNFTMSKGCSFVAKDATGKTIASGECDPFEYCRTEMEIFDPDEIPYEVMENIDVSPSTVNLIKISSASSIKTLIAAITKPFGLDRHYEPAEMDEEEDECEYEDEDAAEIIEQLMEKFNAMVDDCGAVLNTHLTKVSDLKHATVSMEFSGRGEFLADPDEIIAHVFDRKQKIRIPASAKSIYPNAFSGCKKLTLHAPIGCFGANFAQENNIPFVAV